MNNRWLISRTNPEFLQYLSKNASVSPLFAQVLVNRGLRTAVEISDFLRPALSSLTDPFAIPGISAAALRIEKAITGGERILVHGDYDADGVSATAILYLALRSFGADCLYFIPDRFTHGYGFQSFGVGKAKAAGASLIITVDCGITSFDAIDAARREGIDVVVTDHHEPAIYADFSLAGVRLPDAAAVINPKATSPGTAVESLSGAGVALKLVQALYRDRPDELIPFFDLAAIGTVADIVAMTGENRIIVSTGLALINESGRPGLRALLKVSGLEGKDLKAGKLAFSIIPRINAAGRLASSMEVVRLLTTDSEDEASAIAAGLDRLNTERQRIEEEIFQEAVAKLGNDGAFPPAIVLSGAGWHEGVIGIVASRIAERCSRPAIIFSVKNGIAKGSARSVPAFDICKALSDCREMLISYGGHKQAAGIKLEVANLGGFTRRICELAASSAGGGTDEGIVIDADVGLPEISFGLMKELSMLEPLGLGNPEPLFGARMLKVQSPRVVGNNHLRLKLCGRSCRMDAIGFGMGGHIDDFDLYGTIDAAFSPSINEWNGGRYLQLVLKAFRPSV